MALSLFNSSKPVIGVIHVGSLPGTPRNHQSVAELVKSARDEARVYRETGVDGVIIENMHDVPYLRGEVGPEIVAAMTAIGLEVKSAASLPVGIQILAGANIEALAVAHAAGLDFIRAEGYAYAHVADEGLIQSSAAKLLRYRKMIGAGKRCFKLLKTIFHIKAVSCLHTLQRLQIAGFIILYCKSECSL